MPLFSIVDLAGSAGQDTFVFTSPYLAQEHMHMYEDGVERTDFTFSGAFTLILDVPLEADATVRIRRITPIDDPAVDFTNGSVLGETDLDTSALQLLYVVQEASDLASESIHKNNSGNFDALGFRIVNVADPIDLQDAATKRYTDESSGTAAQQAAVEQAEDAAAEAALILAEILAIDLTNVSEYFRTVLAAETQAEALNLLGGIDGSNPTIENLNLTGTVTGADIENLFLRGTVTGQAGYDFDLPTFNDPIINDPEITGDISGTPNFTGTPTFDTPLPGTLTAGAAVTLNPYTVSAEPSAPHGLGAMPTFITWYIECLATDAGYSVGDRISQFLDIDNGTTIRGFTMGADATNTFGATCATAPLIRNRNGGSNSTIAVAKWKLVLQPWRLN